MQEKHLRKRLQIIMWTYIFDCENAYRTKCTLPPTIHPQLPQPLPHTPPPAMNILGPILSKFLPPPAMVPNRDLLFEF